MRPLIQTLAVLVLASVAVAGPRAKAAATRPASQPASRPAVDAPLSREQQKAYAQALVRLKQEKSPEIQTAREALKERAENGNLDYQADQARQTQRRGASAVREMIQARRGHPLRAQRQEGQVEAAQRRYDARDAMREENREDRGEAFNKLTTLEEVWRAYREYEIDAEYEQWQKAGLARARADAALEKTKQMTYPPRFRAIMRPAENAIKKQYESMR